MWQPIKTAPRDGTAVLVMRDNWPGTKSGHAEKCTGHNTYVAEFWDSEGRDHTGRWVCYMDSVHEPTCPVEPTHWMPLPAPPSINSEPEQVSQVEKIGAAILEKLEEIRCGLIDIESNTDPRRR